MKEFKAIAAMSENRVIGHGNKIPWHLPEDFKWFKKMTTGNIVIMGRKTFQSIGKPLPNRTTIILTRTNFTFPGTISAPSLEEIDWDAPELRGREAFICGGAEIYAQTLLRCADLYLTLVKRNVEGGVFFPPFEDQFELAEQVTENPDFKILHYRRKPSAA